MSGIEHQAAQWLVKRDLMDDEPTQNAFKQWLTADARHRAAYLKLELAWRQADRLRSMRPLGGVVDADLLKHDATPARAPLFAFKAAWAMAAALVVCAVLGYVFLRPAWWHGYSTQVGGFQRLILSDGSIVELNTDSELQVRMSSERRELKLLRGEASFKVAQDKIRPFDVDAAGTRVTAVGTAFNVRLRGAEKIEVTVTEGRVKVAAGESTPLLSVGEYAIAEPAHVEVQKVASPEMRRRLSWQNGELIFQGESLNDAVAEFNRYNRRQLTVGERSLGTLKIGGNFRVTDPQSFVDALGRSFGVTAEADGRGGWILRP